MTPQAAGRLKIGDYIKQRDRDAVGIVSERDANMIGISWDPRPLGAEYPERFGLADCSTFEQVPKPGDRVIVRKVNGLFDIFRVVNGPGDRERVRANVSPQQQAWEIARGADAMVWICDEATPDAVESYR